MQEVPLRLDSLVRLGSLLSSSSRSTRTETQMVQIETETCPQEVVTELLGCIENQQYERALILIEQGAQRLLRVVYSFFVCHLRL